jgi:DNA repair exonuclease SbcCD ATPase subunit
MHASETLPVTVTVENLGGIDETELGFEPGTTVLTGRNATNRTSLLRAVMAALGSDQASIKADAEAGRVALELGGQTYTRTFERRNGTVLTGGDPYLEDPKDVELAELFAFLLESNEARRAVARGEDLRELIMRPVDTEAIEAEIQRAMRERTRIDDELDELDELADRLPTLEHRRQDLNSEVEEVETELEEKRAELEAAEASADAGSGDQSAGEAAMQELQTERNEFKRVGQRLETERESVEALESELETFRTELEDLPAPGEGERIESRIETLRERQSRLDGVVTELQSIIEFNEKLLEGSDGAVSRILDDEAVDAPTAELLPDAEQETVCWTCGSTVDTGEIEAAIDRLRDLRQDTLAERSAVREEIGDLTDTQREREERRKKRNRLERRIERTESELTERAERIEELETELAEREARIDELETEVASRQADEQDELLELNRAVNELEFEHERLQDDLAEVEGEIEEIRSRLERRDQLEADREAVAGELRELRERIERIERDAVERFNEHMAEVLEILDYENLDRIWIDRRTDDGESRFDLQIVRSDAAGTVFQDSVAHLSESEREVTGLVFALAGYLVHEVHEVVPVMLLDSIEAIDSERIAALLEYVSEYAESIIVALLPEDATAVDDDYQYVHEI